MLLAGASGSDVDVAFDAATNEVTNNYLDHAEMNLLIITLKGCKTEQCKIETHQRFKEISDANNAKLTQACSDLSNRTECKALALEQHKSVLAYQRGEYDSGFAVGSYERDSLTTFHKTNLNDLGIAGVRERLLFWVALILRMP